MRVRFICTQSLGLSKKADSKTVCACPMASLWMISRWLGFLEENIVKSNRMSYDKFYRFYDMVMGDRSDAARYIVNLIARHKPEAKTVLEIACGTGSILGILSASYEVTGLDRSRPMLTVARKKLPHVRLVRQDMTSFHIARRFDAIVCVFDSINHLLHFSDWRKVFRRVAVHLKVHSFFTFHSSTPGRLRAVP